MKHCVPAVCSSKKQTHETVALINSLCRMYRAEAYVLVIIFKQKTLVLQALSSMEASSSMPVSRINRA